MKTIDFRFVLQYFIAKLARQNSAFAEILKEMDFEKNPSTIADIVELIQKPSAVFPTILYTFIGELIVREKVERITEIFAAAAGNDGVSLALTSEAANLLMQYRLTAAAKQLADSFVGEQQRGIVNELIALFTARRDNQRVAVFDYPRATPTHYCNFFADFETYKAIGQKAAVTEFLYTV